MNHGIPVRYNAVFGIGILAAGAFLLASGLFLGKLMLLTVGVINTLAGFGFATQPWFVVFADRIEVRNMLGMTLKTHAVALSDLEVQGNRVWPKSRQAFGGLGGWLARSSDIAGVGAAIRSAQAMIGRQ
jgi:hypothetical protein